MSRDTGPDWAASLPHPLPLDAAGLADAAGRGARLAVLDDDPTGTQTVRGVPVLTRWQVGDIRWALQQSTTGFFVLTNSRSLAPDEAAARNREVVDACLAAADAEGVRLAFASRSDSTLRGHFPLETDVIGQRLAARGTPVNAVLLVPAYVEAGRITIDGVHRIATPDGLTDVAASEFARDPTFGFAASELALWVEEKSRGRIGSREVAHIDIDMIRGSTPGIVDAVMAARDGRIVAVDAVDDGDLAAVAIAGISAEARGRVLVYRSGPSFVRARLGQLAAPPITDGRLRELVRPGGHGLVVVGSHVPTTTRQLALLEARVPVLRIDLDVTGVLEETALQAEVQAAVDSAVAAAADRTVVLATSRLLTVGGDAAASLDIAGRVSLALTEATARIVTARRPAWVVAKGGITSADVATTALRIARARVEGSLLPGIVSLWRAEAGPAAGLPFIVFAGNVGTDGSLAEVVERLELAGAS